jgi:hypothetical protein
MEEAEKLFYDWLNSKHKINKLKFKKMSEDDRLSYVDAYNLSLDNCRCIRLVGGTEWFLNGCIVHS